ncbi:hypothetical protein BDC45DRAFT_567627 [Circinella umbellata]|nr:hypothetical protein BDC45DRAFT_567627 [Circinella umbellata]
MFQRTHRFLLYLIVELNYYSIVHLNKKYTNEEFFSADRYQEKYEDDQEQPGTTNECESNFKATTNALYGNARYHESGLVGSICARHDVPLEFTNIFQSGEKWKNKYNHSSFEDLRGVDTNFAVSVFHAYAHSMQCQVRYNPRYMKGLGLTDSEGMERLWSYLSHYVTMSRQMSAKNRILTLRHAITHFKKMRVDLASRLARRRKHAEDVKRKSVEELRRMRISMTNEEFEFAWNKFIQSIQLASVDERSDQQKLDEQYVHYLQTFYNAQNALATANQQVLSPEDALETLCNAFKAVDNASYRKACLEIKKIEKKKMKEDERWSQDCDDFKKLKAIVTSQNILKDVLHRSGKLGHNTSTQIIRSANNATAKAKKILNDYNNACKELDPNFPDVVFNEIKSLESPFWEYDTSSRLDFGTLREYSRQLRADEEMELLKDEARELSSYATRRCRRLLKAKETEERGAAYKCLIEHKLADAKTFFYKVNGFPFDEESIIAEDDYLSDEEDEHEVLPEDAFMIDLPELLLRIHGEIHGEESYAELQDELPAGQEFEL